MDRIAKSMIGKGLLALAAFAIAVYLTGQVVWGVIGLTAAWALVLALYDSRSAAVLLPTASVQAGGRWSNAFRPVWEPRVLTNLARLAFPVGIATMLASLNTNIPRYFVDGLLGEGALGIYSAMAYLTVAAGMIPIALGQSASSRLARSYTERDRAAFLRPLAMLVGVGAALGAAAWMLAVFFGQDILTLVYRPEYAEQADVLVWLVAAFGVGSVFSALGFGMMASRQLRVQPFLLGLSAAVSCACCYLLVPVYGLKGAAWAYGASVVVQMAGALLCTLFALRMIREHRRGMPPGSHGEASDAVIKKVGRRLARAVTAIALVRSTLCQLTRAGLVPGWLWKRLPVETTYSVSLSSGAQVRYTSHPNDVIGRALFWRGLAEWESETIRVFLELCPRAKRFIDIGANTGVYTLLACAVNPTVEVLAFEPVPHIYERLCWNVNLNGWRHRCRLRNEAVSDQVGSLPLHVPHSDLPTSASLNVHGFRGISGELIQVPVTTIDSVLSEPNRVDLVKIDVEGFEAEVLQGMNLVLARSKPAIIVECNPDGPFRAVQKALRCYGYHFFHLTKTGPTPKTDIVPDPTQKCRNYLCLSERHLSWFE
jgi:FkbM family methyltransferase